MGGDSPPPTAKRKLKAVIAKELSRQLLLGRMQRRPTALMARAPASATTGTTLLRTGA